MRKGDAPKGGYAAKLLASWRRPYKTLDYAVTPKPLEHSDW